MYATFWDVDPFPRLWGWRRRGLLRDSPLMLGVDHGPCWEKTRAILRSYSEMRVAIVWKERKKAKREARNQN